MPIYQLGPEPVFPDPSQAEPSGLIAVGGDLLPQRLLAAYSAGIFPWYEENPILWFSPEPRTVLPTGAPRVSRRLRRTLRQERFSLSLDGDFPSVIRACARAPRAESVGTWITADMERAYVQLHELGFAHSCEARRDGRLVGGVYGVSLGSAFFGESMFFRERDASKCALTALVWQLGAWGFDLFDCQMPTAHLSRLGAVEVSRDDFLSRLATALTRPTRRGHWSLDASLIERRAREAA